jgi:hypothetical protein
MSNYEVCISQIANPGQRLEILDWYHLVENLHKVGGSIKRLTQAEALFWQGQVDAAIALFSNCQRKQAKHFCQYLRKHHHRIVNYEYFQAEGLYSIGSGAVESAIKRFAITQQLSIIAYRKVTCSRFHSRSSSLI